MTKRKMWKCAGILSMALVLGMPECTAFAAGFAVDGYYDDWEGIPKTKISWSSHNGQEMHEAALVMDDEYLYAYVSISELYHSQIPVNEYYLGVNGKEVALNILGKDSNGKVDWSKNVYNLDEGTHKDEVGVFVRDNANTAIGDAAITVVKDSTEATNDTLEFRVSLKELEQRCRIPKESIRIGEEVTLRNPNLGPQKVELAGTSSGSVLGTVLCISSVGLGWVLLKKRKRILA